MSKFVFTEKKMTEVVTNAVFQALAEASSPEQKPVPAGLHLDSIVQLAGFLGCSYNWAKQIKKEGRIKCLQQGPKVMFFLSDILEAVDRDPSIRRMFLARIGTGSPSCNSSQIREIRKPQVMFETELFPGRFIFATIKYQGWRCNACIPYHLWNEPGKVKDFVNQIIRDRHEKHPFKIAPLFN